MKVSVVVPAYNEEGQIEAVIRALLAQDYSDHEIIVVDNASIDKTAEVAGRFPVTVVKESRKGLLFAREAGRIHATGDIIANIDADCLPEPDWISRGVADLSDPEILAVTGPYDYYDGSRAFRALSLATQCHVYRAMSLILQSSLIKRGAILIGGNNFIRAEVLKRAGGYNTDLAFYGEDTDTARRVSAQGRVLFDPKLPMKTSARRFKAEGTLNLMFKYWFHFFKHLFMNKKITRG